MVVILYPLANSDKNKKPVGDKYKLRVPPPALFIGGAAMPVVVYTLKSGQTAGVSSLPYHVGPRDQTQAWDLAAGCVSPWGISHPSVILRILGRLSGPEPVDETS